MKELKELKNRWEKDEGSLNAFEMHHFVNLLLKDRVALINLVDQLADSIESVRDHLKYLHQSKVPMASHFDHIVTTGSALVAYNEFKDKQI